MSRQVLRISIFIIAAALFGAAFDHYQWFPYQKIKELSSEKHEPRWKMTRPISDQLKAKSEFFRQAPGSFDIFMIGDSLVEQGGDWSQLLPEFRIGNRGIGGETTAGILSRLDEVIERKPKIIVLMAGINDIRIGVPPPDISLRIIQILQRIKNAGIMAILQSTLPTADEPDSNAAVIVINDEMKRWCASNDTPFVDLRPVLATNGRLDSSISIDGLHINFVGYLKWRDALRPILNHLQ
jgi:lysophospholipase L1-like esterase